MKSDEIRDLINEISGVQDRHEYDMILMPVNLYAELLKTIHITQYGGRAVHTGYLSFMPIDFYGTQVVIQHIDDNVYLMKSKVLSSSVS